MHERFCTWAQVWLAACLFESPHHCFFVMSLLFDAAMVALVCLVLFGAVRVMLIKVLVFTCAGVEKAEVLKHLQRGTKPADDAKKSPGPRTASPRITSPRNPRNTSPPPQKINNHEPLEPRRCNHRQVSGMGSNGYQKIRRCKDCGEVVHRWLLTPSSRGE